MLLKKNKTKYIKQQPKAFGNTLSKKGTPLNNRGTRVLNPLCKNRTQKFKYVCVHTDQIIMKPLNRPLVFKGRGNSRSFSPFIL